MCVSRFLLSCLVLSGVFAIGGCSGGKGDIAGKVELNGKPLTTGTVTVFGADGIPYASSINAGAYEVKGVPPGKAKIAVISPNPKEASMGRDGKTTVSPETLKGWVPVPAAYGSVQTSGMSFEVRGGQNLYDINMTGNKK